MYNWNPPVRDQLQAVSTDDVDDQTELEEFNLVNSHNIDKTNTNLTDNGPDFNSVDVTIQSVGPFSPADGNISMVTSDLPLDEVNTQSFNLGLARIPQHVERQSKHDNTNSDNVLDLHTVDVIIQCGGPDLSADGNVSMVFSDSPLSDVNTQITSSSTLFNNDSTLDLPSVDDLDQVTGNKGVLLPAHVPKGTVKVVELTLELFDQNYNLYAQRINHHDDGLFIRAILMKDNIIIFNNTFKILGTSNVAIATIVSADQVCNQYMVHARKGDSFICALGDGQHGVRNPIIRNEHLANFISTLNSIKVKIGMYTIVTGLKSDWLQYANHNSIHQELILAPDKKKPSILPLNHF